MRNGLLVVALFIAATALTSGAYNAFQTGTAQPSNTTASKLSTTTHNPNTTTPAVNTTTPAVNTTTAALTTTTPAVNTTTAAPTTTTPAANTTTAAPNTTTSAPNTTTAAPNTTTSAPNTTTAAPNTTTSAPNTTTTAAPTLPPSPTPPTNVTTGRYNFTGNDGKLCFMADFAVVIRVNNSKVNGTFIVQPSKASGSGSCSEKVVDFILSFDEGDIKMKFQNDDTSKMVYVETLWYDLTYAFKSGVVGNYSGKNESIKLFGAARGHAYSCKTESVYMGNGVHLDFSNYIIQAFSFNNNNYGKRDLCKADQPDYRAPIAVAVVLIILIVIVIIAYLVSRKRRTDGYQSL